LGIEMTLPGHDEPFDNLIPRIDQIIRHHEQRSREVLGLVSQHGSTAFEIALAMIWGARASWHDLPNFHRRMAIFETLAHLEMMATNRQLDRLGRDGVNYYLRI
jgi:hypothetical protein